MWQALAGRLLALRRRRLEARARRLPIPVVSVGNLHLGGSGKTPLAAAIACHLRGAGRQTTILSRGYGRRSGGIVLVSTGAGALVGPDQAGDEPVLLAERCPGVGVVVAADRFAAGELALARLKPRPEVFVLDDGFSHVGLRRDIDLLAFPAGDPFGNGKLAPFGPLREPLGSAARADALVLTDSESTGDAAALVAALEPYGFTGPGFAAAHRVTLSEPLPAAAKVLLVTGVARADRVVASARTLDLEIVEHVAFPDHHRYPQASLERIRRAARRAGTHEVLTTGKDRVKLGARLAGLRLVEMVLESRPETAFWSWLEDRLPAAPAAPLGPARE